jgi:SAM-dependent methyltransferase
MQAVRVDLHSHASQPATGWEAYQQRYAAQEARARICHDLLIAELKQRGADCTVLDIGAGVGFDCEPELQQSIAQHCDRFIGVEPDPAIPAPEYFDAWHATTLEEATAIPAGSVDVAYAYMVLEHLAEPQRFFGRLRALLAERGVFWAFTINRHSLFATISQAMERLRLKDLYLDRLDGARGAERYLNYPTFYRANCRRDLERAAVGFAAMDLIPLWKAGQLDYYLPRLLRPPFRALDWLLEPTLIGATMLALRLQVGG